MTSDEVDVWRETASMRDFYVNPKHWLFTLLTLGVYAGVVYLHRYYTRYRLTNQRVIKESGLLARRVDEIELFRVKDSRLHQTFLQRLVGLGDVEVTSADTSGSFRIENLPGAPEKREQLRTLANKAREAAGIRTIINE
jgi:uncharacterized membrane protein YdbT with pleckstrin-like domain